MIRPFARAELAISKLKDSVSTTTPEEQSGGFPPLLVDWLARLRLLERVPFAYLVPDDELLPPESIRFFYLNRNWTDAAVDGALAVGAADDARPRAPADGSRRAARRRRRGERHVAGSALRRQACGRSGRGRDRLPARGREPCPAGQGCTCAASAGRLGRT